MRGPEFGEGFSPPEDREADSEESERTVTPEEEEAAEKYFQQVIEDHRSRGEKPPGVIKWPPDAERPKLVKWLKDEEIGN